MDAPGLLRDYHIFIRPKDTLRVLVALPRTSLSRDCEHAKRFPLVRLGTTIGTFWQCSASSERPFRGRFYLPFGVEYQSRRRSLD
jgi:hypothetical protein